MKSTATDKFSVDELMLRTTSALIRDFQSNLGDLNFMDQYYTLIAGRDIQSLRRVESAVDWNSEDTYKQKCLYQVESILKRYRFENDLYSEAELQDMAKAKFLETQHRLSEVRLESVSLKAQRILDRAASYIARVLGPYDEEEHRRLCRFGKRASVGVPSRKACQAARWELPISGSLNQIAWFEAEMLHVPQVQEYWQRQLDSDPNGSIFQVVDSLKLTLVPKTFKSLRSIMPNTTIGSYMSYGLGEMMRLRLRGAGYNIKTLQERHKMLACQASRHTQCVTADLSSASDSITDALVKRLFPADWYEVLVQSRIGNVIIDDLLVADSKTFCTMGIGYTFPLQTLVFLSLLKAITSTMQGRSRGRTVSVYGDDMIYHKSIHQTVLTVFAEIGFVINIDKTFDEGHFRESCGGDYFRGVDVRPFQPQGGQANVGPKAYEAVLYKYINGILRRWTQHEVGGTLKLLLSEVCRVTRCIKIVPLDFPDDAGVKVTYPATPSFLESFDVAKPQHIGHGVYRFAYLRLMADLREENRYEPYYWAALRGVNHTATVTYSSVDSPGRRYFLAQLIETAAGLVDYEPELLWRPAHPIRTFRSCLTGRRLRRLASFVTVSHTGRYTRQSGTSCFEDRR